jgi:hypothetical protein
VTPVGNMSETLTLVKTAEAYGIKAGLVVPEPEGAESGSMHGYRFGREQVLLHRSAVQKSPIKPESLGTTFPER